MSGGAPSRIAVAAPSRDLGASAELRSECLLRTVGERHPRRGPSAPATRGETIASPWRKRACAEPTLARPRLVLSDRLPLAVETLAIHRKQYRLPSVDSSLCSHRQRSTWSEMGFRWPTK